MFKSGRNLSSMLTSQNKPQLPPNSLLVSTEYFANVAGGMLDKQESRSAPEILNTKKQFIMGTPKNLHLQYTLKHANRE